MITLETLRLKNFKSFVNETTVQLNREVGLHFITGYNYENETLGANAVGKSTIFDALVFALYGKTPRTLKGKDVCSWSTEGGMRVEFEFYVDGQHYYLVRGWRPNVLQINDQTVQQDEIDRVVGVNFNEALHMLGMGQWSKVFLDLGPTDKLNLLSSVLRLDTWHQFSDLAKQEVKSLEQDIQSLQHKVTSYRASAKELSSSAEDNQKRIEEYEQERQQDLQSLKEQIEQLQESYDIAVQKRDEYKKEAEKVGDYKDTQERAESLRSVYDRKQKEFNDLKVDLLDIERHLSQIEKEADEMKNMEGAKCPECKQEVSQDHVQEYVNNLDKKYESLADEAEKYDEKIDKLKADLDRLKSQLDEIREEEKQIKAKQEEVYGVVRDYEKRANRYEAQLQQSKKDYEKAQDKKNPYQEIAEDEGARARDYEAKANAAEQEAQDLESKKELYTYWVDGAKEIRLYVIEKAIVDLELEVNNALSQLGLGDWSIKFDVARETQSGNISSGFITFVQSPHNDEFVPWNAWSGGETQRLRIAGAMGLSSLISSRRGVSFNCEFYDEPTKGLGGEGVYELLELLSERGKQTNKSVYIIDHRSHDYAGFQSVLNVTKNEQSSVLQEE